MEHDRLPNLVLLGPLGTYSHQVADNAFGNNVNYVERQTITGVFDAVSDEHPFAVIPQENTIYGSVIETYDCFRSPRAGTDVYVRGEVTLAVQHCLLGRKGVKPQNIRRIISHDQAIGQCRSFLTQHFPNATIERVASTAGAAQALLEDEPGDLHSAAICSAVCANIVDGLEVMHKSIQDKQDNHTRFYILSHTLDARPPMLPVKPQLQRALVRLSVAASQPSHSTESNSDDENPPRPATYSHSRPLHLVVSTLLTTFGVPAIRIDRRPSLSSVPFEDVYFVELEELGSPRETPAAPDNHSAWLDRLRDGVERVAAAGGNATILGVW